MQTRTVLAGGHSIASSAPPEVHFGLGGATVVDRVRIRWPDGATSERVDIDTRQELFVQRSR